MKQFILPGNQKIKYFTCIIFVLITALSFGQQGWMEVPTPDPGESRNMLRDIGGTSSNDVWTVGNYESTPGNTKNLVLHWNGSDWQMYSGTDKSNSWNDLWGVTAIATNDVWAVGSENTNAHTNAQLMHWNGSSWLHTIFPKIQVGPILMQLMRYQQMIYGLSAVRQVHLRGHAMSCIIMDQVGLK